MPAIYTYTLLKIHIILTKYTDPREFSRGRLEQKSQQLPENLTATTANSRGPEISASISLA